MTRTNNCKKIIFKLLFAALLAVLFALFIGMATKTSATDTSGFTDLNLGAITTDTKISLKGNYYSDNEVIVHKDATLTINLTGNAYIYRKEVNDGYYMFTCRPGGNIIINGTSNYKLTIDGNQDGSTYGTYSLIAAQGTVELNCVILKNNYVSNTTASRGGAITVWHYNVGDYSSSSPSNKNLTLNNCEITSCVAKKGGGIFLGNSGSGTVTISNTKIHDCKATENSGGALYAISNSAYNVTLTDSNEFYSNTANVGGAISWTTTKATLDIQGGNYYKNKIEDHVTENTYTKGGAIYVNGTVKISGSASIYENTATLGGAIFIQGGTLTISAGTIYKNNAVPLGGGIYMYAGTLNISGSAQIYLNDVQAERDNKADSDGTQWVGRDYTNYGGIKDGVEHGGGIFVHSGTVNMSGGTIGGSNKGNSAYRGAGIYIENGTFNGTGGTISYQCITNAGFSSSYEQNILQGGGIYMYNGTLNIGNEDGTAGTTISNNEVKNGGAGAGVYIAGGNFKMTAGSITNNKAIKGTKTDGSMGSSCSGGGIYVNACNSFTMSGGSVNSNSSTSDGGGIYVNACESFTMTGGSVNSNSSTSDGGGIYFYSVTSGTINTNTTSATVSENTSGACGGGIYINSGSLAISGSAQINDNVLENNMSYGGGLYLYTGTVSLADSAQINGNTANNAGGGVYIYGNGNDSNATFTMNGGEISNNKMNGYLRTDAYTFGNAWVSYGGGIYLMHGVFNMSGGKISGNQAYLWGGGVEINSGTFNLSGGEVSGNTLTSQSDAVLENDGVAYVAPCAGGGFFLANSAAQLIMSGGSIHSNVVNGAGGAIWIRNGDFEMTGGSIYGNTVSDEIPYPSDTSNGIGTDFQYVSGCGAGIYIRLGSITISADSASIYNNTADLYGGAIYIEDGSFTMSNGTIGTSGNPNAAILGGGIYLEKGTVNVSGGSIQYNSATNSGGGIYILTGTVTLSNTAVITENTATSENGGGVYVSSGDFIMKNGLITANSSTDGAGVYVASGDFTMEDGDINSNNASGNGGGVYVAGNFSMSGGIIGGGTASAAKNGGGVYVLNGTFTLSGTGKITENQATEYGGGVYFNSTEKTFTLNGADAYIQNNEASLSGGGVYLAAGSFDMVSGNILSNTAASGNGGGVYVASGNFDMASGLIKANSSTDGAGVYVASGDFTMEDGDINSNNASGNGGGVYVAGNFSMSGGIIGGGTASAAKNGGGVYVLNGTFTLSGTGKITENQATEYGGGVYFNSTEKTFTLNGADAYIQSNKASLSGGGVYLAAGSFDMVSGNILSNTAASGNGGGVYSNGTFTMTTGVIASNSASANGGGVYVASGNFTMNGGAIGQSGKANTALHGGGIFVNEGTVTVGSGSSIAYNTAVGTASTGGGIRLENGDFTLNGGAINANQAVEKGGGIYIQSGNFIMNSGELTNNKTTSASGGGNGGGIYVRRGNFTMYDGTISGNVAAKNGGAAYLWTDAEVDASYSVITIYNSVTTISGGTVTNNSSSQGGAFYIHGGDLTVTGGSFTNNTAENGGGAIYIYEDRYYLSSNNYSTKVTVESGTFTGNVTKKNQGGAISIWAVKGAKAEVVIGLQDCDGGAGHSHPVFQNNVAEGASCGGIYISKDTDPYTPTEGDSILHGVYTTADLTTSFESAATLSIYCGVINGNDGNLKEDVNLLIENGVVVLAGAADLGNEGVILAGGTLTLGSDFDLENFKGIMVTGGTLKMEGKDSITLTLVIDWDKNGTVDLTETASVPVDFPLRLPSYDNGELTTIAWYTDDINKYSMVETTFTLKENTTYTAIVNYWGHGIQLDPLKQADKSYNDVTHADSVTVNNDSAFTVEFAIHHMEASKFGDRVLSFDTPPAAGTTVLLIDKTYASDNTVKYYYYTFTGSETEVKLTSFKQLGSGSAYTILAATYTDGEEDYLSETLTFIFDLADSTSTVGAFDITLTVKSADGNDDKNTVHSESVTLTAKRTFKLTESDSTLSYTTAATADAGDSRYSGKEYSIVVSAKNGSIPSDMFLTVNGVIHYLNKDGYFIIPLGNATSVSLTMTARSLSANGLGLEMTAALWASENDEAPFMGETVAAIDITFEQTVMPTFTVNEETSDRTVAADGTLTVNFEKTDVTGDVTVKIQKKVDGNYTAVGGAVVTVSDTSFTVTASSLGLGASGYETYRAIITVKDSSGNTVYEIPYNFIVIID